MLLYICRKGGVIMAERNLPIGIQSFKDIRNNNYIYVDKTSYIWNLVSVGKYYFLSRPRRFGKSLLISTLEAYFKGEKELFKGLAIEKYEKDWISYPVMKFSFANGEFNSPQGLRNILTVILDDIVEEYDLKESNRNIDVSARFRYLIKKLYRTTKKQVVILVDEYDHPLLNVMDTPQEQENRILFKSFFSALKDNDEYIKFAFFTGVTKFTHISIFSDLNQLNDISLKDEMDAVCGITQEELVHNFQTYIQELADYTKMSCKDCLRQLAAMYDGYHFSPHGRDIYNPFSLFNAFDKKRFDAFWFSTGTPSFLIRLLINSNFDLRQLDSGLESTESIIMNYMSEEKDYVPLLYQTGYLTIKDYNSEENDLTLRFPNKEVRQSFMKLLLSYVSSKNISEQDHLLKQMTKALKNGKIDDFVNALKALFAGIPYPEGTAIHYEREWRNIIYVILTLMGFTIKCEVHSAIGRADCIVETDHDVYIFELKLDGDVESALQQIEEKKYADAYLVDPRHVHKVGINFTTRLRNIEDWKVID